MKLHCVLSALPSLHDPCLSGLTAAYAPPPYRRFTRRSKRLLPAPARDRCLAAAACLLLTWAGKTPAVLANHQQYHHHAIPNLASPLPFSTSALHLSPRPPFTLLLTHLISLLAAGGPAAVPPVLMPPAASARHSPLLI